MSQSFLVGQAIWGKIGFPDGKSPEYERPYLIIGIDDNEIEILTVSSLIGKEWKLTLSANREIIKHDPPFPKRTFVKLDSLQRIPISDLENVRIARGGKTLDEEELSDIIRSVIRK